MGETNFNQLSKTSLLKRISGNDSIDFEFKGKDKFTDRSYATLIIATNTLPTTTDRTEGFYRRWVILKFPNKFSEKIDILDTIPEQEYKNLSKKCINILKKLLETREFHLEGNIEERKKKYEAHSNPIKTFIVENCIEDPNEDIPTFEFYDSYIIYLKERGYREVSKIEVSRQMTDEGFEIKTKWVKVNNDDKQWKHYIGVRLKKKHEIQESIKNVTDNTHVTDIPYSIPYMRSSIGLCVTSVTPVTDELPQEIKVLSYKEHVLDILGTKEMSFSEIFDDFKINNPTMSVADFELLITNLKAIGEIYEVNGGRYKVL